MADEPPFDANELNVLPIAELKERGPCNDHIASHDDFMDRGLKQIMTNTFHIETNIHNDRNATDEDKRIDHINAKVLIRNVTLDKPETIHFTTGAREILTPGRACLENKTYGAALYADYEIVLTAHNKDGTTSERRATAERTLTNSSLPVMANSRICNLYGMSPEALERIGEDPSDPGGYFVVGGIENTVNNMESSTYNAPSIFRNIGHADEVTRLTIISKPGDHYENSAQLIIKLLTNDRLVCIIDHEPFGSTLQIPFFIIFRMLGWSSDKQYVDWILGCDSSLVGRAAADDAKGDPQMRIANTAANQHIVNRLNAAMEVQYGISENCIHLHDMDTILRILSRKMDKFESVDTKDDDKMRWVNNSIMNAFDMWFLPHIGSEPRHRNEKAIYLTHLIRSLFMVEMETIPSTDRDSYATKRAHAACICYAKAFKQQFNFIIVQAIKRQLSKDCRGSQFSRIDLLQILKTAIDPTAFARGMAQAITTGNKTQITVKTGRSFMNRLISQQVHRKNQTNFAITMRMISTLATQSSKQSKRAKEMRLVHNTFQGFIDCIQTQDTESVGLNKAICVSAHIAIGGSSVALIKLLLDDSEKADCAPNVKIIPILQLQPTHTSTHTKVLVNGHWIGCVPNVHDFAAKWRKARRNKQMDPHTTIVPDFLRNEVRLWIDAGRMLRPLLIVYNNIDEPDGGPFKQYIKITKQQLVDLNNQKITMANLLDMGVVEYISPEEQETLLLAKSFTTLWKERNNVLLQFTHCDIPIAQIAGVATLLAPLAAHSPCSRGILAVNQFKQSCGIYSLAWPFRIDKEGFIQYHVEMPLVRTVANSFLFPNGKNIMIAVMCYSGFNQDDSSSWNGGSFDRGMFDGMHLTFEYSELDKGEMFIKPDPMRTAEMKQHANYEKLVNGYIPRGTVVVKDDVLIGKVYKYPKPDGGFEYADRSLVYKHDEEARVVSVVIAKNQEGRTFIKIKLAMTRRVIIGDKFAMRNGQKGVCSMIIREEDMPFTADGAIPDIIFNPFGLPSRMTINLLQEIGLAKPCAARGVTTDQTIFRKAQLKMISAELVAAGFHPNGVERLYCGSTGKYIDTMIFMGPGFYQRLQKFVDDTIYAASSGSSDPITRQPTPGKASNGSIKIGEMEKDVLMANGLSRFTHEKFYKHSSGYTMNLCRRCGEQAIVNHAQKIYRCKHCKSRADIVEVDSSWSSKLAQFEMSSMGIGIKRNIAPFTYGVQSS